jgi:nicotinate-nucleotide adenylyltransferase
VAAARAAIDALTLERLLLVVANDPWQKSGRRPITPAEDRFVLTEALAAAVPGAEASRLEIDRGGPSYSVDTVEAVLATTPAPVDLYLVVGADLLPDLDTWHRPEDLKRLVTVAVVSRPGDEAAVAPPGWRVRRVDGPSVPVSSSEVRDRLASGEPVDALVPDDVIHCIRRRALYAVSR